MRNVIKGKFVLFYKVGTRELYAQYNTETRMLTNSNLTLKIQLSIDADVGLAVNEMSAFEKVMEGMLA